MCDEEHILTFYIHFKHIEKYSLEFVKKILDSLNFHACFLLQHQTLIQQCVSWFLEKKNESNLAQTKSPPEWWDWDGISLTRLCPRCFSGETSG